MVFDPVRVRIKILVISRFLLVLVLVLPLLACSDVSKQSRTELERPDIPEPSLPESSSSVTAGEIPKGEAEAISGVEITRGTQPFQPICTCISLGDSSNIEKCIFTLSGYHYEGTASYIHKNISEFSKIVAGHVASRLLAKASSSTGGITARGFADGIHNPDTRRRDELLWECQDKLTKRGVGTMNDLDLAIARECYVVQAVQAELGGKLSVKWVTEEPEDIPDNRGQGPDKRKVEVVVQTTTAGGC